MCLAGAAGNDCALIARPDRRISIKLMSAEAANDGSRGAEETSLELSTFVGTWSSVNHAGGTQSSKAQRDRGTEVEI